MIRFDVEVNGECRRSFYAVGSFEHQSAPGRDTRFETTREAETAANDWAEAQDWTADITNDDIDLVITKHVTFDLMINNFQRGLIETAMAEHLTKLRGTSEESDECRLLVDMIRDLPTQEEDWPGVTHGLCL